MRNSRGISIVKAEAFVNPLKDNSGFEVSPEIIMWRSVIVRTMLDCLEIDIHAWGYARKVVISEAKEWFDINNKDFELVCDYADLEPHFVLRLLTKIKEKNDHKLFKNKNLHKFLLEYICTFAGEQ